MYIRMSFKISHFESLCQRFPTWSELSAHLQSVEGGSIRVVDSSPYAILRYVKGQEGVADIFRSVVWDTAANRPLCVAPPRAKEGLPPLAKQLSATEDFVDGVMMNAWVGTDGVLHVATRTQVGGNNMFYGPKTFGQMFEDCVAASPLKTMNMLCEILNTVRLENNMTSVFASFVLQHPDHRIVARIQNPGLNTVHLGMVDAAGVVSIAERATNWPQSLARLQIPSYPIRIFHSEQDIQDMVRRTSVQRGWRWQGMVFKDGAGGRWRIRTPTYTMMRELRGSEAAPVDRFSRLRGENQVMDYLKHYSEDRDLFWEFEQKLRARTADVLAAYVDVHKAHAVKFKELPEALRPAVFMLHMLWRDELRTKGFTVRLQNAIQVVNGMRGFERVRLINAEPYVAVAKPLDTPVDADEADTPDETD
jgi:hypothetical protein